MHTGPCLVVKKLAKHFGGLVAVKEVDLTVEYGERRGIIGPNGAGKTTLFNMIAGDLPPTHGEVFLHGQDITHLANYQRAYLGMSRTFQITNLFPAMSVMDNVLLAAQALGRSKFSMFRPVSSYREMLERAEGILERFDLIEVRNNYVKNLSHGIQRQVEIALALVENPRILLLDEPTAGLSPAESAIMTATLKSLDSEVTILIIEHDMDVAFELVDKVMVMHDGEVLADGPIEEIRSNQAVQEIYLGYE
ncbi:MAG: ABC transporter ATP-binding protein [bacterium]|nr:ABC transporter ATP-binding protein [bacterium]